ncbi:MAG: hypothetical protein EZS28_014014 [Streblomastix strix]|uniref:Uncharacterized protein n=1 Tax=Streblomastix strix TaxID=222440 RepID=A0A5J4W6I9_9EUKA|nr:MAG: hypothetical protein EZS28_014014 [Streblomastix strix]
MFFIPIIGLSVPTSTNPSPLKVNVFPLADICILLVLSPVQDATAIAIPQGLISAVFGGVNIDHYPSISQSAAVAFTNGTFTLLGSIFNGYQCVALAYTLSVPAVPVPVSLRGTLLLRFT